MCVFGRVCVRALPPPSHARCVQILEKGPDKQGKNESKPLDIFEEKHEIL